MANEGSDLLEQVDRHLDCPVQSWLLGAGISKDAKIPLMGPLTARVMALAHDSQHEELLTCLMDELPEGAHVEHLLSQLGDYASLAERSRSGHAPVGVTTIDLATLTNTHEQVLRWIADTVRWGYVPPGQDGDGEEEGVPSKPIVKVGDHVAFIRALFGTAQAGLQERRPPVDLFTTNYDTLIEDALALACIPYWDGFTGGAVAFRGHRFGQPVEDAGHRARIIKLHGSIDWHLGEDGRVWRVRDADAYPEQGVRVLIYPQATKYQATQRDPFAAQFELLRSALATTRDNILAVCGYSFGDEHINQEIELAMERFDSKTTLLAFCSERYGYPPILEQWRNRFWGKRVYVMTDRGLYAGQEGPFFEPPVGQSLNWWTFAGVTRLLRDGAEGSM